jgi:Protein of unknown function (DUF3768)
VGEFVRREVIYSVSALVYQIAKDNPDDWHHLFVQDDWETPAYEALLQLPRQQLAEFLEQHGAAVDADDTASTLATAYLQQLRDDDTLRGFCADNDIEPQQTEIYEHWIVSEWLAGQLEQRGEVIERNFYGLTVWGRACTGQAIKLDGVICDIYDDLHKDDEPQRDEKSRRIAEQNDKFRADFYIPSFGPRPIPGQIVCTSGIAALPPETQICIWAEVSKFSGFTTHNDPHAERDFGAFTMEGVPEKIFWKIDYYADKSCTEGSEDPANPARTFRVLTIMLASEY